MKNLSPESLAQFGMTFPLERGFAREFASGLQTLLVVEEKRSFLEMQLRDTLYHQPDRPSIIGKEDLHGNMLLPPYGEFDADVLAKLIVRLLKERMPGVAWKSRMAMLPIRGEVWLVDLGMVAKVRPCLVMSIPSVE